MKTIQAQAIPIQAQQTIEIPVFAKFLSVVLDIRHNHCLFWLLADDEREPGRKMEKAEIFILRAGDALNPPNATFVASFKDNSGWRHVFTLRESDDVMAILRP